MTESTSRSRDRRRARIAAGKPIECPRCRVVKPVTAFYESGTSSYCKECQREYSRARKSNRRTGGGPWVYLIVCDALDAIKIGYSADAPRERLRANQIGNPHDLRLHGVIDGDREIEKFLHSVFRDFRLRGEWFSNAREIVKSLEFTMDVRRDLESLVSATRPTTAP